MSEVRKKSIIISVNDKWLKKYLKISILKIFGTSLGHFLELDTDTYQVVYNVFLEPKLTWNQNCYGGKSFVYVWVAIVAKQ